ncbi:hypothetical protein GX50_05740 [[Emmonsia] crescens]|uniref:Uncharacterized protein n=1 Tax=[Emmonsia] crescens TaxID=73230 RepID=A0A2B7ZEC0_9EURO|nr:hypothetical protein GX50_05740 [Emmonsia crescens]
MDSRTLQSPSSKRQSQRELRQPSEPSDGPIHDYRPEIQPPTNSSKDMPIVLEDEEAATDNDLEGAYLTCSAFCRRPFSSKSWRSL